MVEPSMMSMPSALPLLVGGIQMSSSFVPQADDSNRLASRYRFIDQVSLSAHCRRDDHAAGFDGRRTRRSVDEATQFVRSGDKLELRIALARHECFCLREA